MPNTRARPSLGAAAGNVVRGALIGSVEVVPGVSGGTVALIVGIYERIIASAGHVITGLRHVITDIPRGRGTSAAALEFRRADWGMLIPVGAGMLSALVLVASQVEGFVHDHPELSRALFLGLVAAAMVVPISMVGRRWTGRYVGLAVAAGVAAFMLTGLPPTDVTPSPPIIVLSAAIAVCALVLPGLSGSFILLTFGLYEPALAAVNDRDLGYLAWFVLGAVIGLALFVRALQWLLEHRHDATLAVLTGLMAGGMRALWPWQDDDRTLLAPGDHVGGVVLLFLIGVTAVLVTLALATRSSKPGAHACRN
jgi:putative membrane protein